MIVGFTQVCKQNRFQTLMVQVLEEFNGFLIGEVTMAASDALFQMKRVGTFHEAGDIVIGFDYERLTLLKANFDQLCHHAEICTDSHADASLLNDEGGGFSGVMGNGKRMNLQIADGE